jgi:hypothetical protein
MAEVVTDEKDPVHSEFWKDICHKRLHAAETRFLRPGELDADRELEIAVRGAWGGKGPEKELLIFNPGSSSPSGGAYEAHFGDSGTWLVKNGMLIREIIRSPYSGITGTFSNKIVEASDRMLVLEENDGSVSEWYREITFNKLSLWRYKSTADRGELGDFFVQREGTPGVYDLHESAQVVYRGADGEVYDRPDLNRYIVERYDVVDGIPRYYGPNKGSPLSLKLPEEGLVPQRPVPDLPLPAE